VGIQRIAGQEIQRCDGHGRFHWSGLFGNGSKFQRNYGEPLDEDTIEFAYLNGNEAVSSIPNAAY
jgi:hypothetical protein